MEKTNLRYVYCILVGAFSMVWGLLHLFVQYSTDNCQHGVPPKSPMMHTVSFSVYYSTVLEKNNLILAASFLLCHGQPLMGYLFPGENDRLIYWLINCEDSHDFWSMGKSFFYIEICVYIMSLLI